MLLDKNLFRSCSQLNVLFLSGNSLLRTGTSSSNPTIKISRPPRPDSLTLEFESEDVSATATTTTKSRKGEFRRVPSGAVLPEEITQELEALSQVDDERQDRIAKLEKLRRGEEILPDADEYPDANEDQDASKTGQNQPVQPESTESSVEGT